LPYDFDAADSSGADYRCSYTETAYSQRGLSYRQRTGINPADDPDSGMEFLETHSWFDENGQTVGSWGPTAPATKTTYDGLGRSVVTYTTDRGGDDDPNPGNPPAGIFTDVYNIGSHEAVVTDDVVVQQMAYEYSDNSGLLRYVTTYRRTHDATDSDTGDLQDLVDAGGDDEKLVILTFTTMSYDDANRVETQSNFGTNDADNRFIYGGSLYSVQQQPPPTWDDELGWSGTGRGLPTLTAYNARGLVDHTIDAAGVRTSQVYDDMNRRIAIVENHDDLDITLGAGDIEWDSNDGRWIITGGLATGEPDVDRVTSFVYDGNGNIIKQVAHVPGGANGAEDDTEVQVTAYNYGVDTDDSPQASELASNDLLRSVVYPAGDYPNEVDRTVFYARNRQGETTAMEDQNGVVHEYERDDLGRLTLDKVTDFNSTDIDDTVQSIETEYYADGRIELITSYDGTDPGTANVLNQVKYIYAPLGQLAELYQEHDGEVDEYSYVIYYDYEEEGYDAGSANTMNFSRVETLTYHDGTPLTYDYGTQNSSDDRISRLRTLGIDNGQSVDPICEYHFIGLGMTAVVDLIGLDEGLDVQLDHTASITGERQYGGATDNPGYYPAFDRYGRLVQHLWVDGAFTILDPPPDPNHANQPPIVAFEYDNDKVSNRTRRTNVNPVLEAWTFIDEEFEYDGLSRLITSWRGERTGGEPGDWDDQYFTFGPDSRDWDLDMLGNWAEVITDEDADGPDGDGSDIDEDRTHNDANELTNRNVGTSLDLEYDKVGNIVTQDTSATTITYTHDAWNRLVGVEYGQTVRGSYVYNGLNWRILKQADTDGTGGPDQQRLMHYSAAPGIWQLLEEDVWDAWTEQTPGDIDRHVQYVWGHSGGRYIDDILLRREDRVDNEGDPGPDGDYDDGGDIARYYLTDAQFTPVAILDDGADVIERISYMPYGHARHHRMADLDGDGDTDSG
jgi:YD repeat-containing protein